jgi:hypothetical protein
MICACDYEQGYLQFASFGGCLAKSMFFEIVYEVDKESTYILYFLFNI